MKLFWYFTAVLFVACNATPKESIVCFSSASYEKEHENISVQENCSKVYNLSAKYNVPEIRSNTVIKFICSLCYLNFTLSIEKLNGITVTAASSLSNVKITCGNFKYAGMKFSSVNDLTISNLILDSCGSISRLPDILNGITINVSTALLLSNGTNLTLQNVKIIKSFSSGFIISNVIGNVSLLNILISETKFPNNTSIHNGNVLAYSSDTILSTNVNIKHSNFTFNRVDRRISHWQKGIIRSCGLVLYLNRTENIVINISHVMFYNNSGFEGGHMAVVFHADSAQSKPVIILDTVQFMNGYAYLGGGLYITVSPILQSINQSVIENSIGIVMSNCTFSGNNAEQSGGGILLEWEGSTGIDKTVDIIIKNSVFSRNSLTHNFGGLAIFCYNYVLSQDSPHYHSRFQVNLYLEQCSFNGHLVASHYQPKSAVIFSEAMPFIRMTQVNITSNKCRAILAVNTVILFHGNSIISNNTASTGAGLRLCSNSFLFFSPQTHLQVIFNHASETGGGVWVEPNCYADEAQCFYQYTHQIQINQSLQNSVQFTVKDNAATRAGDNLYGGSIQHCYFLLSNKTKPWISFPNNSKSLLSSVASNPQKVCILYGNESSDCRRYVTRHIYPGKKICFFIRLYGELQGAVPGVLTASTKWSSISINSEQLVRWIPKKFGRWICYTVLKRNSIQSPGGDITLFTKYQFEAGTTYRNTKIVIKFAECPLGYDIYRVRNFSLYECHCNTSYFRHSRCPYPKKPSEFTKLKYSWIGIIPRGNESHWFVTSNYCPSDYCKVRLLTFNPRKFDVQCRYNRTGIMCGSCMDGLSLQFGNSKCVSHCTHIYLLLIFPFALIGFLVVVLIGILNMTVTTGTINGIIFYLNILQDNNVSDIVKSVSVPFLSPVLLFFMSWLNLDLGIPVCFYKGMGAISKTLVSGLFPMYLWAISVAIIILSNKFVFITQALGNNAVKILATLIVLSYSKILRVAVNVFSIIHVDFYDPKAHLLKKKARWILDGTLEIAYPNAIVVTLLIAAVFIIILLPFTLSLLFVKQTSALSNYCKCFSFIDKLKPFFDAYTGILKDRVRFWPGLLLLCRIIVLLTKAIFPTDLFMVHFVTSLLGILLLLIMIKTNGVYTHNYLNILECFFIANILAIMIALTSFNYFHYSTFQKGVTLALISVAFLTTIGIVSYHIYLKLSKYRWCNRCLLWNRNTSVSTFSDYPTEEHYMPVNPEKEDSDQNLSEFSYGYIGESNNAMK